MATKSAKSAATANMAGSAAGIVAAGGGFKGTPKAEDYAIGGKYGPDLIP